MIHRRFLPQDKWTENEKKEFSDRQLYGRSLTGQEFNELLKKSFEPWIKTLGFKGSNNNFRKIEANGLIKTLGLFKDRSGGELSINFGFHCDFLPVVGLKMKPSSKFSEIDCFIRKTFDHFEGNSWFVYGTDASEGEETIQYMKDSLDQVGLKFFDLFNDYPNCFLRLTVEDFSKDSVKLTSLGLTSHWFWHQANIAAINNKFDNQENAKKIIDYADKYIKNENFRKLVKPIIERIRSGDTYPSFKEDEK
jgi:hypothetical protein